MIAPQDGDHLIEAMQKKRPQQGSETLIAERRS